MVATVIMVITLMSVVRYFYSFSDINMPEVKEKSELNYIPFIKDSLSGIIDSYNGDCNKLQTDLNTTKNFLKRSMIERGIVLDIIYNLNCPPPSASFNFTIRTSEFYTETLFTYP